ncbi:phage holin family protein [Demequina muriae]|uniref:Phage holin family protein n=1 Tax=Demequina muriae TaxID=3051664 RepID=A0ABT8GEB2_9MICO|nr:phage holin family protein [Demequina sp. EGI L300058]MDN4479759.1 phage holin family protein [Demequina sp. EGI L300058]
MIRFLIRVLIFVASSALGLWVASLLLDDFEITVSGFVTVVVIFAIAQSILSPFILKMSMRYANAFTGGVGLVSTFVALLIATLVGDGLEITGVTTWVIGTLIVWLVTAIATLLLPLWWLKERRDSKSTARG